ncbi:hypothetical protein COLO4_30298 [Corchorus olitorius]|uniref:CASP-like protein n=1 Tax=Corchorus olitorius TaxID=93759 RepID=A0A1R3H972_9ROSI|nr:hypothetical protein COLO4_30298 [Corchorus olitorius]
MRLPLGDLLDIGGLTQEAISLLNTYGDWEWNLEFLVPVADQLKKQLNSIMLNPEDRIKDQHVVSPVPTAPPAPTAEPVPDVVEVSAAISSRRREREDMLKRGILMSRLFAFLFSLLASIFMASNRHGDGKDFDNYEEYRYLLAIACIATVYSGGQGLRYANKISIGRQQREEQNSFSMIDLVGDEVAAYLLVSAASAAVP